jgi:hypothetical protein
VTAGKQYSSYGIHFTSSLPSSLNGRSFFLWADKNGNASDKTRSGYPNYIYDDSDSDGDGPAQEIYNLPTGFYISRVLCMNNGDTTSDVNILDIVFKSPDPEANFGSSNGTGGNICSSKLFAGICLTSPNLKQSRLIKTYNNGQIMVENPADKSIWTTDPCPES